MKPQLEGPVQWILEHGTDHPEIQDILLYGSDDEIAMLNMCLTIVRWRQKRDKQ